MRNCALQAAVNGKFYAREHHIYIYVKILYKGYGSQAQYLEHIYILGCNAT